MDEIPERLERRATAAKYIAERFGIPCSPNTLAKLSCMGGGPPFRKAGNIVLYDRRDLDAWAQGKLSPLVKSTSELTRSVA